MRALIVSIFLALSAQQSIAAPTPAQMQARSAELMEFIKEVTGLPIPPDKPRFVFRTPREINQIFMGPDYREGMENDCEHHCVKAFADGGVITLATDFKLGRDDAILAHELTHFVQWASQKYHDIRGDEQPWPAPDECHRRVEWEAYRVQSIFVAATGIGIKPNDLFVLSIALSCEGM